jgi:hypothetical protein
MRRLLMLAAAVLVVGSVTPSSAQRGDTMAPDVVAWWAPLPVVPPDVAPGELYVAGSGAVPLTAPGLGPVGPLAVAGLRFQLPVGAHATQLTLRPISVHPLPATLTACRALTAFPHVDGGAWSELPGYDCSVSRPAAETPLGDIVIEGIDALRRGQALDIVLVPGLLDRVVLAAPGAGALSFSGSSADAATAPPTVDEPTATPPVVGGPAVVPSFGPATGVLPPPVVTAPSVPAVAGPIAEPVATVTDDRPWQALVAAFLIAMATFALLVRPGSGTDAVGVHGVGRLRRERSGTAPEL